MSPDPEVSAVAKKPTAPKAKPDPNGDAEKTCFVVIGFGMKTDFATGRTLNLDLTYDKLIKPAFDNAGIRCFRAIDVNVSGSIDKLMYRWIYEADFVIADLSTMNANVFYELGVRHAQRPNTTLIMGENGLFNKLPFDLSHTIIYGYEHLGEEIADEEAERFVGLLTEQIEKLLAEPGDDSPVYTYMPGMKKPEWTDPEELIAELEARLAENAKMAEQAAAGEPVAIDPEALKKQSLAMITESAEAAKNRKDFPTAISLFKAAIENDTVADKDQNPVCLNVFLWQRLALVTYKNTESNDAENEAENEAAKAALHEAEKILIDNCELFVSTDPETLGLAGAINKRLYQRTDDLSYFEKSVFFYERGFYIKQDYYNGINVAFMYTVRAAELAEEGERYDAIVNYGHGRMIRKKVADVCHNLIDDTKNFSGRGDKEWIYQTLAQAYLGMGQKQEAEKLMPEIEKYSKGEFDMSTFLEQNAQLVEAMATFERLVEIPAGDDGPAPAAAAPKPELAATAEAQPTVIADSSGPTVTASTRGSGLRIDLGDRWDKPVKSVEVKVEFG